MTNDWYCLRCRGLRCFGPYCHGCGYRMTSKTTWLESLKFDLSPKDIPGYRSALRVLLLGPDCTNGRRDG